MLPGGTRKGAPRWPTIGKERSSEGIRLSCHSRAQKSREGAHSSPSPWVISLFFVVLSKKHPQAFFQFPMAPRTVEITFLGFREDDRPTLEQVRFAQLKLFVGRIAVMELHGGDALAIATGNAVSAAYLNQGLLAFPAYPLLVTSEPFHWGRTWFCQISGVVQSEGRACQAKLAVFQVVAFAINDNGEGDSLAAGANPICAGHPFPCCPCLIICKGEEVPPTGLEPVTPQFSVECSTRLS